MDKKSMISQLATVGESTLGKLASSDLSKSALQGALMAKEKIEKLMSSMTDLDERVAKLEERVTALESAKAPAKRAPAKPRATKSATAAKATPAAKKPSAAEPAA
jgi:hypothetical protein